MQKFNLLAKCYVEANKLAEHSNSFLQGAHDILASMESSVLTANTNEHLLFWKDARQLSHEELHNFYRYSKIICNVAISRVPKEGCYVISLAFSRSTFPIIIFYIITCGKCISYYPQTSYNIRHKMINIDTG